MRRTSSERADAPPTGPRAALQATGLRGDLRLRELARQIFYGLRGHVAVSLPGVIRRAELAPINVGDIEMAPEVFFRLEGWTLADRNCWSPDLTERLKRKDVAPVAPLKSKFYENTRFLSNLTRIRRRIETVIGQMVPASTLRNMGYGPVACCESVAQKEGQTRDSGPALPARGTATASAHRTDRRLKRAYKPRYLANCSVLEDRWLPKVWELV